jgi:hypothetical protein
MHLLTGVLVSFEVAILWFCHLDHLQLSMYRDDVNADGSFACFSLPHVSCLQTVSELQLLCEGCQGSDQLGCQDSQLGSYC